MKRYTLEDIYNKCHDMQVGLSEALQILIKKGILKIIKPSNFSNDRNEYVSSDNLEQNEEKSTVYYVFNFVGVIIVKKLIIKCYPKYLTCPDCAAEELKLVLKVIEKYAKQNPQILFEYDANAENVSPNRLGLLLYFIRDYDEFGLYTNNRNVIEINGMGEILWDKTVNEIYPLIYRNRPFYTTLYTRRNTSDEENYFHQLHAMVLTSISRELENVGLLNLFDIMPVYLSKKELDDFGDIDTILYRLECEEKVQFNTRKIELLQAMQEFFRNKDFSFGDNEGISVVGTISFNMVWEGICSVVFGNQRNKPLGELKLPIPLLSPYHSEDTLISLIEKPRWKGDGMDKSKIAEKTLVPDFLAIFSGVKNFQFIILDAKYYVLQLEKGKKLCGQPGIESLTKQYLYELAYHKFLHEHKIFSIKNAFLFPTDRNKIIDNGYAEVSFLHNLGLKNIAIRLLPARMIYQKFLLDEIISLGELRL